VFAVVALDESTKHTAKGLGVQLEGNIFGTAIVVAIGFRRHTE
jgi:hypothetical protein